MIEDGSFFSLFSDSKQKNNQELLRHNMIKKKLIHVAIYPQGRFGVQHKFQSNLKNKHLMRLRIKESLL